MYIYKEITRYNNYNGNPYQTKQLFQIRSDWSGMLLWQKDKPYDTKYYGSIVLDYGSQDPCYGYSKELDFAEKYGIDIFEFMSENYYFYSESAYDHEFKDFSRSFAKSNLTLESFLRENRIRVAEELITSKIISPEELKHT